MRRVCLVLLAVGSPLLVVSFWLPEPWGPGVGALLVGVLPAALIGVGVWGGSASGISSGRPANSLRSDKRGASSETPEALPPAPVEQGWWKKTFLLLTLALISPFVLAVYLLRGVEGWWWGLPWPTAVLVYGALFLLVWTGAVYAATFGREGGG
jgi:hypothetical protein